MNKIYEIITKCRLCRPKIQIMQAFDTIPEPFDVFYPPPSSPEVINVDSNVLLKDSGKLKISHWLNKIWRKCVHFNCRSDSTGKLNHNSILKKSIKFHKNFPSICSFSWSRFGFGILAHLLMKSFLTPTKKRIDSGVHHEIWTWCSGREREWEWRVET